MVYTTMAPPEIAALAVEAAKALAGDDVSVNVTAEEREDYTGQPAYYFSFKLGVPKGKDPNLPPGLLRLRLIQQLLDRLLAKEDSHYPIINTLILSDLDINQSA